ncbi:MAG: hypothetical protein M5R42_06575 [Rhodocyclaceae bacterium]|nr:hypothetical protein [Rhodocyclaceae bacterium]
MRLTVNWPVVGPASVAGVRRLDGHQRHDVVVLMVTSLGESRENRILLRDIIHKLDPDGKRGMKQSGTFRMPNTKTSFDNIR